MITQNPMFNISLLEYVVPDEFPFVKEFDNFEYKELTDTDSHIGVSATVDKDVLSKLTKLNNHVLWACKNYMSDILSYKNEPEIISSWITKTAPGGKTDYHVHENSLFTGVYYPEFDPGISLRIKNPFLVHFKGDIQTYNSFNSDFYDFVPKKNTIIIFDSRLEHRININKSKKIRRSLAFTVGPRGAFGNAPENTFYYRKR